MIATCVDSKGSKMFLTKRSNGYYHLHFKDSSGKWREVSAKSKNKAEANRFLVEYKKPKESTVNDTQHESGIDLFEYVAL